MAARTGRSGDAQGQLAEYRRKRDFTKTAEPSGADSAPSEGVLRFVVQKHAASHLHFDLRLEMDGVMKSWAVPKGPSVDPSVKRLAMQVEDHPIDYNTFEGTIPKGEYGGGTVMLWDQGTYIADGATIQEAEAVLRERHQKGDLKLTFFGERMKGSWALVRMKYSRDGSSSAKPQWLFIKHRDEFAAESDIVAENTTSVTTGRTMDEIASGKSRVWHSNRTDNVKRTLVRQTPSGARAGTGTAATKTASSTSAVDNAGAIDALTRQLEPMYASIGTRAPGAGWNFEPKYDGIRVLAFVAGGEVRLVTRNGKDKSAQFPEVVESLRSLGAKKMKNYILDGEIVALIDGEPGRFQELQGRMHVQEAHIIARHRTSTPAALILFDILAAGDDILIREPWEKRRKRLVKELGKATSPQIWVTPSIQGDGDKMLAQAEKLGWEGLIAKRIDAVYEPGIRSRSWLKLKIESRQEFVVGGFTEPRNSRQHLGALLLGYFDRDRFIYVGHTGGGFTGAGLAEMFRRLEPLEIAASPFEETPKTNGKAHWVKPQVVVEVKFSEWTGDGKLRQPIYLGTRDDKKAKEVGRESGSMQKKTEKKAAPKTATKASSASSAVSKSTARRRILAEPALDAADEKKPVRRVRTSPHEAILAQLEEIESKGADGRVEISPDIGIDVTNLGKIFFPKNALTKGDLMRYYVTVAPLILPVMADRPLVLKRFPNGVSAPSFFQQNAGDPPAVVRTETIHTQGGSTNLRIVGGDLATLLYLVQLGSVSVDPWHSRAESLDHADYSIIDLDPGPRAQFKRVVEVAQWAKETMDSLGLHGALKTSGSRGLHIYLPLPPTTPNEAATLVAQIIATRVSEAHPKEATIERAVKARGASMVYVDYLQNIIGKTVAGAYSARANPDAMVSTPLEWDELTEDLDPREFTIETTPARFAERGDIWAAQMKKRNSLRALV
ncbi:MAG: DNA ligase D [Gemmatimonadaceae bacterium]|nr:DNA ligase D [Gemmatimonadaceae bacterium]